LKLHQPGKPIAIPKSAATLRQNIEHLHDAAREGDIARMQQIVADDTLVDARPRALSKVWSLPSISTRCGPGGPFSRTFSSSCAPAAAPQTRSPAFPGRP